MSKSDLNGKNQEKREARRWVITVFILTIIISGVISLASEEIMADSSLPVAFCILFVIIIIGILFDMIGMAVATADEKPFHSMAARRVPGAQEAILLLRNAQKVSSICNDVVGDICGVVSGAASATIAVQILAHLQTAGSRWIGLAMSALAAGLTVGGKAIGKEIAMKSCTTIVHGVGKLLAFSHLSGSKKKK